MFRWVFGAFVVLFSLGCWGKDYIPTQAFQYKPVIQKELDDGFSAIPDYNYLPSLIEHESCITLTHPKCWNPKSRLKTYWETGKDREEGAGLGQITRAWKVDGVARLDALGAMKSLYKAQLGELSWGNVYLRPDLQIRMMTLQTRDIYKRLYGVTNGLVRLQMMDSAYNGGEGDLVKSRRVCGLAKGCDPQFWFGHVEKYNVKSNKVLYGNRSAKDINNHHVRDVFEHRLPKYQQGYFTLKDKHETRS